MKRVWTIVVATLTLAAAGCGGDTENPNAVAPASTDAPAATTIGDTVRRLSDALAPVSSFIGAQDECFGRDGCGEQDRRDALKQLQVVVDSLFTAGPNAGGDCREATRALSRAVSDLMGTLEDLPGDAAGAMGAASAGVDKLEAEVGMVADACP